jgi:hypothetical protein
MMALLFVVMHYVIVDYLEGIIFLSHLLRLTCFPRDVVTRNYSFEWNNRGGIRRNIKVGIRKFVYHSGYYRGHAFERYFVTFVVSCGDPHLVFDLVFLNLNVILSSEFPNECLKITHSDLTMLSRLTDTEN